MIKRETVFVLVVALDISQPNRAGPSGNLAEPTCPAEPVDRIGSYSPVIPLQY